MAQQENEGLFRQRPSQKHEERTQYNEGQVEGNTCFSCGHNLAPDADICEACGEWQLGEQCCFCYTPFKPGQKFCTECGNSPVGITCKQCGTHSHFDICPKCAAPLSKQTLPAQEAIRNSPEIQELEAILKVSPPEDQQRSILEQLNNYGRQEEKQEQTSFKFSLENKDFSGHLANHQKQNQETIEKKIKEMQNRTFVTNQSARMFYESIKVHLSKYKQCSEYLGWRCEYAYAVHYEGPSTCDCPSMGGRWICKDEVEMINQWEFILEGVHYKPRPETPRIPRQ